MKVNIVAPITIINPMSRATASEDEVQPDLLYFRSVLVSTGKNKNDDVFLPSETWAAKDSPVLKPVDWEHETGREIDSPNPKVVVDGNQIIGTIYDCYVADKNGNRIDEKAASAADFIPPQDFDIVIDSVVYKYLYPKTAAKIAEEAEQGKLFVSMEAWFKGHDYLVGSKVVARNDETSFLDKHLRFYGGEGKFNNESVGRVLRKIVFGGVGFVRKPANDESVIRSVTNATEVQSIKEEMGVAKVMADSTSNKPEPTVPEAELKAVAEKLAKAEQNVGLKVKELETQVAKVAELEKSLETIKSAVSKGTESLKTVLGDAGLKLSSVDTSVWFNTLSDIIVEKFDLANKNAKELESLKADLAKAAKEKRDTERGTKLELEFGLASSDKDSKEVAEMKKGKKVKMMVKCSNMTDEEFSAWVVDTKELISLSNPAPAAPAPQPVTPAAVKPTEEAAILETVKINETVPAGNVSANSESQNWDEAMTGLVQELFGNK